MELSNINHVPTDMKDHLPVALTTRTK